MPYKAEAAHLRAIRQEAERNIGNGRVVGNIPEAIGGEDQHAARRAARQPQHRARARLARQPQVLVLRNVRRE